MSGLFDDQSKFVIEVWNEDLYCKEYYLLDEIINPANKVAFGCGLTKDSSPRASIIKREGESRRLEFSQGFIFVGVHVDNKPFYKHVMLSASAVDEGWRRIVDLHESCKGKSRSLVEEVNTKKSLWSGRHRVHHSSIKKILDKNNDSKAAIYITKGNEIDRALEKTYLSKRLEVKKKGNDG